MNVEERNHMGLLESSTHPEASLGFQNQSISFSPRHPLLHKPLLNPPPPHITVIRRLLISHITNQTKRKAFSCRKGTQIASRRMASTIFLRRASAAASSPLLKRLIHPGSLRPIAATASPVRSFSTDLQASDPDDVSGALDVDRRRQRGVSRRPDAFPSLLDTFDPFSPSRSLSQLFNMMDQFFDTPFLGYQPGSGAGPAWRGWSAREDDKALYIRKDMPGVDKDKVKIRVEQDTLIIQGESEKETEEDDEQARRYSSRLTLPSDQYKVDQIKAEMKNGVLKVTVPKVEEAERKDVKEITVE